MDVGVLYNATPNDGREGTYAERVQRLFLVLGHSRAQVEDLSQETFFEAHRRGGYRTGNMSAKTWLFLVARQVRKRWRDLHCREQKTQGVISMHTERTVPPSFAEDADLRQMFDVVIARLDDEERQLFVLYFYEQHSREELADVFEVPIGTIDSRTGRLRSKVKALLGAGKGDR